MKRSRIIFRFSALLFFCSLLGLAACHKNKNNPEDTTFAADQVATDQTFNDVETIADESSGITGGLNFRTTATTGGPCATVTHSGDTITVDFGKANCTCKDGRHRRGRIIITYTGGSYTTPGSQHTITFDNFYQNDNKITGYKSVTNMGNNAAGQPFYNVHMECSLTKAKGGTVSVVWDRVRTWTAGNNTADKSDDVYEISGSGTLTRANGDVISINIAKPLVVALNCRWIEAGTIAMSLGSKTRTVNYGDTPACDDNATVTLANGDTKVITLP